MCFSRICLFILHALVSVNFLFLFMSWIGLRFLIVALHGLFCYLLFHHLGFIRFCDQTASHRIVIYTNVAFHLETLAIVCLHILV